MKLHNALILILTIFLSGCANHSLAKNSHPVVYLQQTPPVTHAVDNIISHLSHNYASWRGVKYQFGGTTHQGIDCSSYMQHVFREEFSISLPRTTTGQIRRGIPVSLVSLHAGDLVFFNTGAGKRHVGVLISHHEFLHASSSHGVTISDLNRPYWQIHYLASRRLPELSTGLS